MDTLPAVPLVVLPVEMLSAPELPLVDPPAPDVMFIRPPVPDVPPAPPVRLSAPPAPLVLPAPETKLTLPPAVAAADADVPDTTKLVGAALVPPAPPLPKNKLLDWSKPARIILLVIKLRLLASAAPRVAVAPKLLPPCTKAAPAPVVLQVAMMLVPLRHR